jgi:hypothetical protein
MASDHAVLLGAAARGGPPAPAAGGAGDALALLDDAAHLAGGSFWAAVAWSLHAALVTGLAFWGRAPALRVFDAYVAAQPLVLLASFRSLALARAAAPALAARLRARGVDVAALLPPPARVAAARRWAPAVALWMPAAVALGAALALAAAPPLRDSASGVGGAMREALALALGARALLAPAAALAAIARLLRAAAADFFARSLPGADAARVGAWVLPGLAMGGRGSPAQAPDAAMRELFGARDAGGLLHDAAAASAAIAPAGAAFFAACGALAVMNAAAAAVRPAAPDAGAHVAHALALAAVGIAGVGGLLLLANAWLDPLLRWLRREPPADVARAAAEGWAAGGAEAGADAGACAGAGAGGAAAAAARADAVAAHLEADRLKAWYVDFLAKNGPLLQARVFGVAVDQKVIARAGMAWVLSVVTAAMWAVGPSVAARVD